MASLNRSAVSDLRRAGRRFRTTKSFSVWAKGGWASFTRRGTRAEAAGRLEDDPRRQPGAGDHLSRFRVEAEAVARLRHPNIIQIYDIGEAEGLPFVALELLDGGGLNDRLAGNPQAARPSAELMITLARAVHVAHLADIVHRDLKPTNVLYSTDGLPKITDFGLAKRIDSDGGQTVSGEIMGSPSYTLRGHE